MKKIIIKRKNICKSLKKRLAKLIEDGKYFTIFIQSKNLLSLSLNSESDHFKHFFITLNNEKDIFHNNICSYIKNTDIIEIRIEGELLYEYKIV